MAPRITPSFRPPGNPRARIPPAAPFPYEAPVHFYAGTTVQSGAEASLRARGLSNLTGKPVEIHEIRFNTEIVATSATTVNIDPGVFTEVRLDLDGKPITNGFVPVWLLGRSDNYYGETISASIGAGGTGRSVLGTATWRLPQPMRMRAGSVLNASVRHRGQVSDAVNFDLGLSGRYIAPNRAGAGLTRIPYAAAFVGTATAFDAGLSEEIPETALWNALKQPLHVERLTGRIVSFAAPSVGSQYAIDSVSGDFLAKLMRVRLGFSFGQALVPAPLPFGALFSPASGATLELPFILQAGEYLTGLLEKDARGGAVSANLGTTYSVQPQIALSGWREE